MRWARVLAWDQIARLGLAPILIAQGLYVRSRAQQLPEPVGARSGGTGRGPRLRLLIMGDSSAAGVGTDHQEQALSGQLINRLCMTHTVDWRVEATTGHTTLDTLDRLEALPKCQFDVVVTALGVNDVTHGTSRLKFINRQEQMVSLLKMKFSTRLILMSGVPPMQQFPALPQPLAWVLGQQAARLDQALANVAGRHAPLARHLPFDLPPDPALSATDGYHPNAAAYALWADRLADEITQSIQDFIG